MKPGLPLAPHEKGAILFLLRHLAAGLLAAACFGGALLAVDLGGLHELIRNSESPAVGYLLLFGGLSVTFGSVAMGVGIMSLAEERD